MKKQIAQKTLSLLLALLMLSPALLSCGESKENTEPTTSQTAEKPSASDGKADADPAETEMPDPFADFDYNGQAFRVSTSTNAANATLATSNLFIEGPEELTGDAAPDEAYERNRRVEDLLNVSLEFTGVNYDYSGVGNYIRQYVTAASNDYDLFINDIYGTASLTLEGAFLNALGMENFDFSQPWWYPNFMRDISMNYSYQFMLAGDFFIDVLRSSHVLLFNKSLYTDLYGDGNEIYEIVLNGDWTYDRFVKICDETFADLNGNGQNDPDDRYGYVAYQSWGPMIPFLISANPGYVERDDQGYPTITVYNERSLALMEYLIKIFNSSTSGALTVFHDDSAATLLNFTSGKSIMIGDQRIGSLENAMIRDMEQDFAVLPYPKLTEQDSYVTSAHDTSEVGLIPITVSPDSTAFISAVIEVLCRETYKAVLPVYYDSSIKMKYTRDQNSAQMLDIIHDNIGDSFPLAWSNELDAILLQGTFYYAVVEDGDFASRYKKLEKVGTKKLERLISTLEKNIGE